MSPKKILAANWKMNLSLEEGVLLVDSIKDKFIHDSQKDAIEIIFFTPSLYIKTIVDACAQVSTISVGAQNCHQYNQGAYTGEISASMIKSVGGEAVIIGHSERRQYYGESEDLLCEKAKAVLSQGLDLVYCVGEPLEIREDSAHLTYVRSQLYNGLFKLDYDDKIIIAYEPVWAIGTGKTATTAQIQEMHAYIRSLCVEQYGDRAHTISILYGGSVKPSNAEEIFSQKDVDGGLIGGASLNSNDFIALIKCLTQVI